ncbi:MAG: carboxypeptidase-like regulatory domain-containing protein [Parabacteroides sp.]|nr:carboxypeptidase-like regulatory domain-containing protein [Parabacteroides sp.]
MNYNLIRPNKKGCYYFILCILLSVPAFSQAISHRPDKNVQLTVTQQNISLVIRNKTLKETFDRLREVTNYVFLYDAEILETSPRVSLNAVNAGIDTILRALESQTGLIFRKNDHTISVKKGTAQPATTGSSQQAVKVTGMVVDERGEPVIGANIVEAGTSNGTITDTDGKFTLTVAGNQVALQVSYIGYLSQKVATKGKSNFRIVLEEDSQKLDEVVVVGFGTQKKASLTAAVSSVDMNEVLGSRPVVSVAKALQGVVPGLRISQDVGSPGQNIKYNIRGETSINGGEPLVLVNNVPMSIEMIDPQDVESISILKDAGSTAIYGARAAFGVILITTKKGERNQKPVFNYNNNFSFSSPFALPEKASPLEELGAYEKMNWSGNNYVDGTNLVQWREYMNDYQLHPQNYPDGYFYDDTGNLY